MPVNRKKMKALKEEYGAEKGENIYYAMENKAMKKDKMKSGYMGGGMVEKKDKPMAAKMGYAKGGYVNCGASMKPVQKGSKK